MPPFDPLSQRYSAPTSHSYSCLSNVQLQPLCHSQCGLGWSMKRLKTLRVNDSCQPRRRTRHPAQRTWVPGYRAGQHREVKEEAETPFARSLVRRSILSCPFFLYCIQSRASANCLCCQTRLSHVGSDDLLQDALLVRFCHTGRRKTNHVSSRKTVSSKKVRSSSAACWL